MENELFPLFVCDACEDTGRVEALIGGDPDRPREELCCACPGCDYCMETYQEHAEDERLCLVLGCRDFAGTYFSLDCLHSAITAERG